MTGKEFHLISDDRVEEMQTRIAELEEALRPFAVLAKDFADTSDYKPVDMRCDDCRHA